MNPKVKKILQQVVDNLHRGVGFDGKPLDYSKIFGPAGPEHFDQAKARALAEAKARRKCDHMRFKG